MAIKKEDILFHSRIDIFLEQMCAHMMQVTEDFQPRSF
jgi:hypothetical protein